MPNQLSQKEQILAIIDKYITRLNGSSTLEDIKNEIIQIPDNEWIPVSERLPEKDGDYIIFDGNSKCQEISLYYSEDKIFSKSYFGCNVTHWMPLPTPPIS